MKDFIIASEQISLFCRLNINTKKELPIRSSEMGFLIYLVKGTGEKTSLAAAEFFKVSKAMITNMVTSLINKDYIIKEQSALDKRSFTLVPTNKTIKLVDETYREYFKTMALLEEKMGNDFAILIDMLTRANNILLEEKKNG